MEQHTIQEEAKGSHCTADFTQADVLADGCASKELEANCQNAAGAQPLQRGQYEVLSSPSSDLATSGQLLPDSKNQAGVLINAFLANVKYKQTLLGSRYFLQKHEYENIVKDYIATAGWKAGMMSNQWLQQFRIQSIKKDRISPMCTFDAVKTIIKKFVAWLSMYSNTACAQPAAQAAAPAETAQ